MLLTDAVTEVRRRADKENDEHVSDAEISQRLVAAYREGVGVIKSSGARSYFTKTKASIALTTSANTYDLAANVTDFVEAVKLERDCRGDGTYAEDLYPYDILQRNQLCERRWTIYGKTLMVEPATFADGTYRLWYVYQPADPASAIDDPFGLLTEFMIEAATLQVKDKGDRDTANAAELRSLLRKDVAKLSGPRMSPRTAVDVNQGRGFLGRQMGRGRVW